jgi:hypothetical protein
MDVTHSLQYLSNKNISNILPKINNHQGNVDVSEQTTYTLTQSSVEEVTYDIKPLRNQRSVNEKNNIERDMSHLGSNHSMGNKHGIILNMETNQYKYGQLVGKEKVDEFLSMTDRLGLEQSDKMKYLTPSQDWLDLADKMTDEQLNNLVDLTYEISESVFLESNSSEEVDNIIQKLNTLDSNGLNDAINTMLYLTEQGKNAKSIESRGNLGLSVNFQLNFSHKEGEILRDYMEMTSSPQLKEKDIAMINEHLVNMDYAQASGLMEGVKLMEGQSKKQLFDLLKNNETDEIAEIFTYIGELSTKSSNLQQYHIEYGNGKNQLSSVFDPKFSDSELSSLIENILSVENKTDLNSVIDYIDKFSTVMDQAQVTIWDEVVKSTDESSSTLNDRYVDNLIGDITANIVERHEKKIRSTHKIGFEIYGDERSKVTAFNREV